MKLKDFKRGVKDEVGIDPRIIVIDPHHNPRDFSTPENIARVRELKESIRAKGVLTALWVRVDQAKNQIILVAGETRLRACLELIAEGIDIVSVPSKTMDGTNNEQERLLLAMTENNVKQFSPVEFGVGCRRFKAWGWEIDSIARELGVTSRQVRESIELAESPEEVKTMVKEGKVSEAVAIQQVRKSGTAAVKILKERVESSGGKKVARAKAYAKPNDLQKAALSIVKQFENEGESNNDFVAISILSLVQLKKALG